MNWLRKVLGQNDAEQRPDVTAARVRQDRIMAQARAAIERADRVILEVRRVERAIH